MTGIIGHIPISALFASGGALGIGVTVAVAKHDPDRSMSGRDTAYLLGGAALAGVGLLGAMRFEHTVGPYVDRFAVDGAERITRRSVNLDWATKSGRLGAVAAGVGSGAMMSGVLTLI